MNAKKEKITFTAAVLSVICGVLILSGNIELLIYIQDNSIVLPVYMIVDTCVGFAVAATHIILGAILCKKTKAKIIHIIVTLVFAFYLLWFNALVLLTTLDVIAAVAFYFVVTVIFMEMFFLEKRFYNKHKGLILSVIVGLFTFMIMGYKTIGNFILLFIEKERWLYFLTVIFLTYSLFIHDKTVPENNL